MWDLRAARVSFELLTAVRATQTLKSMINMRRTGMMQRKERVRQSLEMRWVRMVVVVVRSSILIDLL